MLWRPCQNVFDFRGRYAIFMNRNRPGRVGRIRSLFQGGERTMRKHMWLLVVSLLFAAAACGPTATPAPTSAPVATTAPAVATTAPTSAPAAPTAGSTTAAVVPAATAVPPTAVPAAKKTVLRLPEDAKI